MNRLLGLLSVMVIACSGDGGGTHAKGGKPTTPTAATATTATPTSPTTPPTGTPPRELTAEGKKGLALERGNGVARDYKAAAAAYDPACKAGDKAACQRFALLLREARGMALDENRAKQMFIELCDGGAHAACIYIGRQELPKDGPRFAKVSAACKAGDPGACVTYARVVMDDPGDEKVDDIKKPLQMACEKGHLLACTALFGDLAARCEALGVAREGSACVEALRKYVQEPDKQFMKPSFDRILALCAEGDADACAYLPGKEIPLADLCNAHDHYRCQELAYDHHDATLAATACDGGGLRDSCYLAAQESRMDVKADATRVRGWVERACTLGSDEACAERDAGDTVTGCGIFNPVRYAPGKHAAIAGLAKGAHLIWGGAADDSILSLRSPGPPMKLGLDFVRETLAKDKVKLLLYDDAETPVSKRLHELVREQGAIVPSWKDIRSMSSVAVIVDAKSQPRALLSLRGLYSSPPANVVACARHVLSQL